MLLESLVHSKGKAKKNIYFVSCNGLEKNRVGTFVGRQKKFFLHNYFGQKCVFYACFTLIRSWEGGKTLG